MSEEKHTIFKITNKIKNSQLETIVSSTHIYNKGFWQCYVLCSDYNGTKRFPSQLINVIQRLCYKTTIILDFRDRLTEYSPADKALGTDNLFHAHRQLFRIWKAKFDAEIKGNRLKFLASCER